MNELNFGALAFTKLNDKLPRERLWNRPKSRAYVNGTHTSALSGKRIIYHETFMMQRSFNSIFFSLYHFAEIHIIVHHIASIDGTPTI